MHQILTKHPFSVSELPGLLNISDSKIITLVGAGGKTTLLNALGLSFSQEKYNTLITTSTHMMRPDHLSHTVFIEKEEKSAFLTAFQHSHLAAFGLPCTPPKNPVKWSSPSLSFLRQISDIPDKIICEGDGSKKKPLKIPRQNEPVFFPHTDTVIGVIGLSCLHQPSSEYIFGQDSSDLPLPAYITPELLSFLALSSQGLKKNITAEHFLVLLNQADVLSKKDVAPVASAAQKIRDNGISCHIVSLKHQYFLK